MNKDQEITNLEQLLDRISEVGQPGSQVSWGAILDVLGRRSFGPLLLLAGLFALAPIIGDIPGMSAIVGLFVFLIAVQLLLGREHFWLPPFLLNRSVARDKLHKALQWLRSPAQFIDRLLQPRLTVLVEGVMVYAIALIALSIAMMMPVLEFVPFSANIAGVALTAYGLSLIAHDGLLALIAFVFNAIVVLLVAKAL